MEILRVAALMFVSGTRTYSAMQVEEWQRRAVYQVVTDRFALPPGGRDTCDENPEGCLWGSSCGGSWWGIIDKLDYIQGMGFDAIYISPIVKNIPCGYHGYWTGDLWEVNPRFGGEEALQALMTECQNRGIAVMLDTVYNHMGPPFFLDHGRPHDFEWILQQYAPFNKREHFHQDYENHCSAQGYPVSQRDRELCWMGHGLGEVADLAQEHPFVTDQLLRWTKHVVSKYHIDGIRADAVPYINKTFWQQLKREALKDTYIVGEVVVRNMNAEFAASYQYTPDPLIMTQTCDASYMPCTSPQDFVEYTREATLADHVTGDVLDATLSSRLLLYMRLIFQTPDGKSYHQSLSTFVKEYYNFYNLYKSLGKGAIFTDTHDNPRFLYQSPDWRTYQSGITMTFFLPGVAIAYYGMEQGMNDPGEFGSNGSRVPLWRYSYNTSHPLYRFTAQLVKARQAMIATLPDERLNEKPAFALFPEQNSSVISWWRGSALVVLSQMGSSIPCACVQTNLLQGTCMHNALSEDPDNEICVQQHGLLQVSTDGMPRVFFQKSCNACANVQTSCSETCNSAPSFGRAARERAVEGAETLRDVQPFSLSWFYRLSAVAGFFACGLIVSMIMRSQKSRLVSSFGQQPLLAVAS